MTNILLEGVWVQQYILNSKKVTDIILMLHKNKDATQISNNRLNKHKINKTKA